MSHVSPCAAQSTQVTPPEPHAMSVVPARQAPVESQQPPVQIASHGQAPPPMFTTDWHVPDESQHPSGQVWALHTKPVHWPLKQAAVEEQV